MFPTGPRARYPYAHYGRACVTRVKNPNITVHANMSFGCMGKEDRGLKGGRRKTVVHTKKHVFANLLTVIHKLLTKQPFFWLKKDCFFRLVL